MKNILHELWYGNINPCSDAVYDANEEKELKRMSTQQYDKLSETLTDQQKEVFEKFIESDTEFTGIREREIFRYAFRLGARITFEVMSLDA